MHRPAYPGSHKSSMNCVSLKCHRVTVSETPTLFHTAGYNRRGQGTIEADRGLRAAIAGPPHQPVQIFSEFLDQPAFGGDAYEHTEMTYLREKYAPRPPDVIIAVSDNALDFLLRNRTRLFEAVPLVHIAVAKSHLQSIPNLPADVVGVPLEYDFSGTIEQALRWHPAARRLVIVTGASQ